MIALLARPERARNAGRGWCLPSDWRRYRNCLSGALLTLAPFHPHLLSCFSLNRLLACVAVIVSRCCESIVHSSPTTLNSTTAIWSYSLFGIQPSTPPRVRCILPLTSRADQPRRPQTTPPNNLTPLCARLSLLSAIASDRRDFSRHLCDPVNSSTSKKHAVLLSWLHWNRQTHTSTHGSADLQFGTLILICLLGKS